jgi:hypothetical protein
MTHVLPEFGKIPRDSYLEIAQSVVFAIGKPSDLREIYKYIRDMGEGNVKSHIQVLKAMTYDTAPPKDTNSMQRWLWLPVEYKMEGWDDLYGGDPLFDEFVTVVRNCIKPLDDVEFVRMVDWERGGYIMLKKDAT